MTDQDLHLQTGFPWYRLRSPYRTPRPGGLFAGGPSNTLVVWHLDRLGQSMSHLVKLVRELRQQQVGFLSLGDGAIDTTTASGDLVFHIFSALAQFERRLIEGVSELWISYQTDTPNSYRLMKSPITKSCMRSSWKSRSSGVPTA
jgi:hypothetical protein